MVDFEGENEDEADIRLSCFARMNRLTKVAWRECRRQPKYLFCFICLLVSRLMNALFAVYIQLWVISFQKTGVLATKRDSDYVYRNIFLGA